MRRLQTTEKAPTHARRGLLHDCYGRYFFLTAVVVFLGVVALGLADRLSGAFTQDEPGRRFCVHVPSVRGPRLNTDEIRRLRSRVPRGGGDPRQPRPS